MPTPSPTNRPAAPTPTRTARPADAAASAPCAPGQIKANRDSGIYHAPGQRDYARTRTDVLCFDGEPAAEAAGFRKAKQ